MSAPTPFNLEECLQAYQQVIQRFGFNRTIDPGRIQILGWDLEYVCGSSLASLIDSTLIRRLNDFIPDTEAPLILDCGANIGFTVLNYARQFPKARIIAFEPDPQFAPVLRRNLERNASQASEVVEAAAWIAEGQAPWFCEGVTGSHLMGNEEGGETVTVRTVDLGRYLANPVDLLKIDIEGSEYAVIAHLEKHLGQVKNILVECHIDQSKLSDFGELLDRLRAAGFSLNLNTFGTWRDLIRQPAQGHGRRWEQYVLVAGWRTPLRSAAIQETALPYAGIELALAQQAVDRLTTELDDRRARERQLLQLVQGFVKNGPQAIGTDTLSGPFQETGECGWVVGLPTLAAHSDCLEEPERSGLVVFENGRPLGPAHSLHAEIQQLGGGRYSHWQDYLCFSTSDGSAPNTNGRTYTIVFPTSTGASPLDFAQPGQQ